MNSLCVVPDEPVDQLVVETRGIKQFEDVIVDELLLDGAVESFYVSIHFWSSGIGMVVGHMKFSKFFIKVFHKF